MIDRDFTDCHRNLCESIAKSLRLLLLPSTIARRRHLCYPFANPSLISSSSIFPIPRGDYIVMWYHHVCDRIRESLYTEKKKKKKRNFASYFRINSEISKLWFYYGFFLSNTNFFRIYIYLYIIFKMSQMQ